MAFLKDKKSYEFPEEFKVINKLYKQTKRAKFRVRRTFKKFAYRDTTDKWASSAKPNTGIIGERKYSTSLNGMQYYNGQTTGKIKVSLIDSRTQTELEAAEWLHKMFGGDLYHQLRIGNVDNVTTADFYYSRLKDTLELKTIKEPTENAIYNASKKGKTQSKNILLDVSHSKMSLNIAKSYVINTMSERITLGIDRIIIRNNDEYIVYEI